MKNALGSRSSIKNRVRASRKVLLILDFDGTLAPIGKDPRAVVVGGKIRKILVALSRRPDRIVAVASGRSLKDIRARLRVTNIIYIGNHGLEISGKGLRLSAGAKKARKQASFMRLLAEKLRRVFYFWPGVFVENKVFTLSVHFRNLRTDRRTVFDELIKFYRRKFRRYPIAWRKGKKVWEVRPSPGWGKGHASMELCRKFPNALPVTVGDDRTDEEMFRSLGKKGITVRVGRSKRSHAMYYVRSQREVRPLLEGMLL